MGRFDEHRGARKAAVCAEALGDCDAQRREVQRLPLLAAHACFGLSQLQELGDECVEALRAVAEHARGALGARVTGAGGRQRVGRDADGGDGVLELVHEVRDERLVLAPALGEMLEQRSGTARASARRRSAATRASSTRVLNGFDT